MKFTTACLLLLLSIFGTRFKMHHRVKINLPATNHDAVIDLDDYWPFVSTLEKGDPYLLDIFLSQPFRSNFKKDDKAMITANSSITPIFQKSVL